jgi:hypothetical protein
MRNTAGEGVLDSGREYRMQVAMRSMCRTFECQRWLCCVSGLFFLGRQNRLNPYLSVMGVRI